MAGNLVPEKEVDEIEHHGICAGLTVGLSRPEYYHNTINYEIGRV